MIEPSIGTSPTGGGGPILGVTGSGGCTLCTIVKAIKVRELLIIIFLRQVAKVIILGSRHKKESHSTDFYLLSCISPIKTTY